MNLQIRACLLMWSLYLSIHGSSIIRLGISFEMGLHGDDSCLLCRLGLCPADVVPFGSDAWLVPSDLELVGRLGVSIGMLPKMKGAEGGGGERPPELCMEQFR